MKKLKVLLQAENLFSKYLPPNTYYLQNTVEKCCRKYFYQLIKLNIRNETNMEFKLNPTFGKT